VHDACGHAGSELLVATAFNSVFDHQRRKSLVCKASSWNRGEKFLCASFLKRKQEYADMTGDESCQTSWFTFEGYATILEEGAACFTRAQIVEFAESIYLLALIPLREHTNAFAKIAACHRNLAALYQKLDSEGTTRFLGRYFRVGFYGVHFGAINGQEFVYRGPGEKTGCFWNCFLF
jgi:hypothetical protein